jgi:hypothetical protein
VCPNAFTAVDISGSKSGSTVLPGAFAPAAGGSGYAPARTPHRTGRASPRKQAHDLRSAVRQGRSGGRRKGGGFTLCAGRGDPRSPPAAEELPARSGGMA